MSDSGRVPPSTWYVSGVCWTATAVIWWFNHRDSLLKGYVMTVGAVVTAGAIASWIKLWYARRPRAEGESVSDHTET
jgi:hypothetical protein